MLARLPNTQVATVTQRRGRHVRSKRESLGIPPFHKPVNGPWTKKLIAQLGKASDTDVAGNLGVNMTRSCCNALGGQFQPVGIGESTVAAHASLD